MSGVSIVLLCEDKKTETFVRTFLRHRNFKRHDIETLPLPGSDGGAGEQWVREKYPEQLKAIRQQPNAYLIVVIDADDGTIDKRHRDLEEACEAESISPRNNRDKNVLHIIPRRNIETWLAYLDGENVNETTDYKTKCRNLCPKECAHHLYDMCHVDQRLRKPVPDSLLRTCEEYRKLQR